MEANTHLEANSALIGVVVELAEGRASAALDTIDSMVIDERGLVHGGFVFGLADYAAMLAVNDPNVVLGAATTRFVKPVAVGSRVVAQARVVERDGRKRQVEVEARVDSTTVFEGTFVCFVLEHHVLDTTGSK